MLITAIVLGVLLGILASLLRFTEVEEGTAKVIVKGDSFHKVIMSYEDHHLSDDWEVVEGADLSPSLFQSLFGLYFVGIWPFYDVDKYKFEWAELRQDDDGVYKVNHRKDETNFIFVKDFPYVGILDGAETKGKTERIPIDIRYVITVRVTNPYKARFKVDGWLSRTIAAVNSEIRDYVGTKSFAELVSNKEEFELIKEQVISLNKTLLLYGVEIIKMETQAIDLAGDAGEKVKTATTRKYVAEKEAEATIAEAKGKAGAITKIAQAEAKARNIRAKSFKAYEDEAGINPTEAMSLETTQSVGENGNLIITGAGGANILISKEKK